MLVKNYWTSRAIEPVCTQVISTYWTSMTLGLEIASKAIEDYIDTEASVAFVVIWPIVGNSMKDLPTEDKTADGISEAIANNVGKNLEQILFNLNLYEMLGVDCSKQGGFKEYMGNPELFEAIKNATQTLTETRNLVLTSHDK